MSDSGAVLAVPMPNSPEREGVAWLLCSCCGESFEIGWEYDSQSEAFTLTFEGPHQLQQADLIKMLKAYWKDGTGAGKSAPISSDGLKPRRKKITRVGR